MHCILTTCSSFQEYVAWRFYVNQIAIFHMHMSRSLWRFATVSVSKSMSYEHWHACTMGCTAVCGRWTHESESVPLCCDIGDFFRELVIISLSEIYSITAINVWKSCASLTDTGPPFFVGNRLQCYTYTLRLISQIQIVNLAYFQRLLAWSIIIHSCNI